MFVFLEYPRQQAGNPKLFLAFRFQGEKSLRAVDNHSTVLCSRVGGSGFPVGEPCLPEASPALSRADEACTAVAEEADCTPRPLCGCPQKANGLECDHAYKKAACPHRKWCPGFREGLLAEVHYKGLTRKAGLSQTRGLGVSVLQTE